MAPFVKVIYLLTLSHSSTIALGIVDVGQVSNSGEGPCALDIS